MQVKCDKQFQAEDDARTLTVAQEVMSNGGRRKRALAEVNRKADLAVKVSKKLKEVFGG